MAENWRRNPEHPPYALMICKAIQELDEYQGSTEESISGHIKSHYDQLPPGHDRLLPYYLNKFLVIGEFFRRSDGCYILAHEEEEEVVVEEYQDCMNNKENYDAEEEDDNVEVHEPLQSIPPPLHEPMKALALDDEGVPMECEGDLVVEIRALDQNPELGLVGPVRTMGCVVGLEPVVMAKDGSESTPRKRHGRPRRRQI